MKPNHSRRCPGLGGPSLNIEAGGHNPVLDVAEDDLLKKIALLA